MSDEIEKFVLQYSVDLKDSLRRLDELQEKVSKVHDDSAKAQNSNANAFDKVIGKMKEAGFKSGALSDGLKMVQTSAAGIINPATIAFTVIAAGVAKAIKSTRELNDEFQRTRQLAFSIGETPVTMVQNRRTFGMVGLDAQSADNIQQNLSQRISSAYTSMDPMSEDAVRLRGVGVSYMDRSGQRQGTTEALDQMTKKLKNATEVQAYAMGNLIGLTQRDVDAIRARTVASDQNAQMSTTETARMYESQKASNDLTAAQTRLDTVNKAISNQLGSMFLPLWSQFDNEMADFLDTTPQKLGTFSDSFGVFSAKADAAQGLLLRFWDHMGEDWSDTINKAGQAEIERQEKMRQEALKQEAAARQQKQASDTMERNVKMFGAAVGAFTDLNDQSSDEDMANWAASVGKASGLKGMGDGFDTRPDWMRKPGGYSAPNETGTAPPPTQYDRKVDQVWGPYADVGKAILQVESSGNPNAKNPKSSASGLMQVLKGSWKPGEDPFDPDTSIEQGYRVFMQKMRATGGDVNRSIMMYGENTPEYLAKVRHYLPSNAPQDATRGMDNMNPYGQTPQYNPMSSVQGSRSNGVHAETYDSRYALDAQRRMAQQMGMPLSQLNQPNEVSNRDKTIAYDTLKIETLRNLIAAQTRYQAGLQNGFKNSADANAARTNYYNSRNDWRGVQALGQGAPGGGAGYDSLSNTGQRQFTYSPTFNFAATTPKAAVDEVVRDLKTQIKQMNNNHNSGVSH
ncbi:lytic transglycosylase domain-containing protein [Pantoea sp. A4]|uniref:lytic transglycosylase domain-containing protein n=1 Tax=Pantoea sp. A4 TaxID=1225184 RepID=UPI00036541CA|nr:lytic transglycosylase domain-containing protein [Pantoea sp. A4]